MDFALLWEWLVTAAMISSLLLYLQWKWNRREYDSLASKLPGPTTIPFIGNIFYFLGATHEEFILMVQDLGRKYWDKTVVRFWFGPQLVVGLYKPEHLEAVLCNAKIIDKSPLFSLFQVRTKGSFTLAGEAWRKQRRFANKMFHASLYERYLKVFNEQSHNLVNYLMKSAPSGTFDISRAFMRCTLDTICRTALGVNMYSQEDETMTFPDDLTISSEIILERMYKPWYYPTIFFKRTKIGKEMFRRIENIHKFTMLVISKRKEMVNSRTDENTNNKILKDSNEDNIEPAPYIDTILEYAKEENVGDFQLALEILDVIIGGMDTSAIADSYALMMLAQNKVWQDKIHKEIDEIFGNSDRDVTVADLGQLVQLEMVIKEVLRLYTAPHTLRQLNENVKLEKYTLPAGTIIYASMYTLHRDPEYWSHPEEFYPEHFLPENIAARPKHSYLPFSVGPRGCPGSKYGMISMKIALAMVLRKFRVECDLKFEEMRYKPSLMLELVGGYPVRLIPRQSTTS